MGMGNLVATLGGKHLVVAHNGLRSLCAGLDIGRSPEWAAEKAKWYADKPPSGLSDLEVFEYNCASYERYKKATDALLDSAMYYTEARQRLADEE